MNEREAMKLALEAMESAIKAGDWVVDGACDPDMALVALRQALAQPEQEPVAWGHPNTSITGRKQALMMVALEIPSNAQYPQLWLPLYTTPPQREWVGLTDEEMAKALSQSKGDIFMRLKPFARAIEAKLKEKNA